MKTTTAFRFIIAAMAAIPVFASCQKERADEIPDTPAQTDEVRVITLQFDNSTKTALDSDGLTPKFEGGDQILLSNGTDAPDTVTVSVVGGIATCTTKLKGTLTAVYPVSAAKLNKNVIEGILVPTVQDGTFKSANICMAENVDASANFVNQTAVFRITPGAGASAEFVRVFVIGAEIANYAPKGSEFTDKNKIIVPSPSAAEVFVSMLVPSGLRVCDLGFADGTYIKNVSTDTGAIAVNSINTVSKSGWKDDSSVPYVEIAGYKWAKMNVGASSETDIGRFFLWGDISGQTYDPSTDTFSGGGINPNKPTPGDAYLLLPKEMDAAYVNYGFPWHTPSIEEFNSLIDACNYEWTTVNGVKGGKFTCKTDTSKVLFIPAGGDCHYWNDNMDYQTILECMSCERNPSGSGIYRLFGSSSSVGAGSYAFSYYMLNVRAVSY